MPTPSAPRHPANTSSDRDSGTPRNGTTHATRRTPARPPRKPEQNPPANTLAIPRAPVPPPRNFLYLKNYFDFE